MTIPGPEGSKLRITAQTGPKVRLLRWVKACPGMRQAWFESNVGLIRKPILVEVVTEPIKAT